jgi:hypothetical protein
MLIAVWTMRSLPGTLFLAAVRTVLSRVIDSSTTPRRIAAGASSTGSTGSATSTGCGNMLAQRSLGSDQHAIRNLVRG